MNENENCDKYWSQVQGGGGGGKKGKRVWTSCVSVIISNCLYTLITSGNISVLNLSLFLQTIKSRDAWNSAENSTDFPHCYFDICHVNNVNNSFFCEIKASHEGDSALSEVVAYYERVSFKWSLEIFNTGDHNGNSKKVVVTTDGRRRLILRPSFRPLAQCAVPCPPSTLQHFSLIAQSNSSILSVLMCDFLSQLPSFFVTALGFQRRVRILTTTCTSLWF